MNRTACGLDPFPTKVMMSHLSSTINIIICSMNLCFSSGNFPASCKSAIISPLIKNKVWIQRFMKTIGMLQNCHLFNFFLKLLLPKYIRHLINNDIVDTFQSAYKTGHSCETALLRVYNDNVTTIGRVNGAMLVLLDLSAAFDTIDHDSLFCILQKFVLGV